MIWSSSYYVAVIAIYLYSNIKDVNSTLSRKQNSTWVFYKEYGALAGLSFEANINWNEALIECVFGLATNYAFSFLVTKPQIAYTRRLLNGCYNSSNDFHTIALLVSPGTNKNGGFAVETWNYNGSNVLSDTRTKIRIYYR